MSNSSHNPGAKVYGPYEYALGDELRGERATLGKTLLDIQRDLRIKAAYIAAIEDCKPEVFPNPSFIAGYVRSYARYLSMDPDEVFHRFCQESGFVPGSGGQAKIKAAGAGTAKPMPGGFRPDFPLARQQGRGLPQIPLSAIGSVLVLVGLVGALGYGGWTVLQNIQRVQFAPVEELPVAVAEVDALEPPEVPAIEEPALTDLASPVAATALADLYRQQELEVPILVPRDGPIAALDPDETGVLASAAPAAVGKVEVAPGIEIPAELVAAATAKPDPQVTETPERPAVVVVAERAAWVRIYQANGTVIFEKILEKGEAYTPPDGIEAPLIWAGNSGSVYVRIGDELRGPLGSGTRAAKDVPLDPAALAERYGVVTDVPEVISQSFDGAAAEVGPAVAIR
jgi:cytoskeletal protein RodZ